MQLWWQWCFLSHNMNQKLMLLANCLQESITKAWMLCMIVTSHQSNKSTLDVLINSTRRHGGTGEDLWPAASWRPAITTIKPWNVLRCRTADAKITVFQQWSSSSSFYSTAESTSIPHCYHHNLPTLSLQGQAVVAGWMIELQRQKSSYCCWCYQ